MRREIATLAMLAIILMGGVGAINAQYSESVTESNNATTVTNESFTADLGNVIVLNESNRDVVYNDTVTVRNASTGTVIPQAGNYSFLEGNGTLRINASSTGFADGDQGEITYRFTVPDSEQRAVRDISMLVPGTLGNSIMLIFGLAVALAALVVASKQAR